jgi:hypothetical protein
MDTTSERTSVVDECTWLDWAAANTPARPADDALTLNEARELCRKLSHPLGLVQLTMPVDGGS